MTFSQIQKKDTLEVTRYYVDGIRVNFETYISLEYYRISKGKTPSCFLTTRTRNGNFKHSKEL